MPLDIRSVFGPKKLFTEEQLEIINRMRGDFLLLATNVSGITHRNPIQEKGFEHLKEALHCFERSLTMGPALTPDILAEAIRSVELRDLKVEHIWVNPNTFCDIRKYFRDIFDAESRAEVLKSGIQGKVWNAIVHLSRNIPNFSVALITEGEENLTRDKEPFEAQLYRY
jgi:hypothetical protein